MENKFNAETMVEKMVELLRKYEHDATTGGCEDIVDVWLNNKGSLMETLAKHPNYNGNGQIVLKSTDFSREIDHTKINVFGWWVFDNISPEKESLKLIFDELARYYIPLVDINDYHFNSISYHLDAIQSKIKPHNGEKTSRFVSKLCREYGLNTLPDFEREFAKYADAINPTIIKRTTVISVNPLDYLTMSFGNSWASCHTIDKHNHRNKPNAYQGQYCSGTLSYMLDGTSIVVYTIDDNYNGNNPETQDKITRCMFHYGEDKLIQGRMYPQSNDGNNTVSKELRVIVQKVMAECLGIPNYWNNKKGTKVCCEFITSRGTNYRDWSYFNTCNVSTPVGVENVNTIIVGHNPICPCCGEEHTIEGELCCDECNPQSEMYYCTDCGEELSEDEVYWVDDEPYCGDCVTYCEYHGEYEANRENDFIYVHHYGNVCEEGFDAGCRGGDFATCDHCGEPISLNYGDYETTEDDEHIFCSMSCAESEGYILTDDNGWIHEDEMENCGYVYIEHEWVQEDEAIERGYIYVGGEWVHESELEVEDEELALA